MEGAAMSKESGTVSHRTMRGYLTLRECYLQHVAVFTRLTITMRRSLAKSGHDRKEETEKKSRGGKLQTEREAWRLEAKSETVLSFG